MGIFSRIPDSSSARARLLKDDINDLEREYKRWRWNVPAYMKNGVGVNVKLSRIERQIESKQRDLRVEQDRIRRNR